MGSRRACDKLIEEGKVSINGRLARLGDEVKSGDEVVADGKPLTHTETLSYFLMNKPKGCICSVKDDRGRKTVMNLLPENAGRVFPVGRLDYDTEGMLILTNDGDLAFRLTHPKNEIEKTYLVKVDGCVSEAELNKLRGGIELDGKRTNKSRIRIIETDKKYTKLHVTINEGRNRQVRRMFEFIGKEVVFLKRIRIGELGLGALARGKVRKLTAEELFYLKHL